MKRVEEEKNENIIEIQDDVRIGDFILEKGDKIVVLEADDEEKDDDAEDDEMDDKDDDEDEKDEKKK